MFRAEGAFGWNVLRRLGAPEQDLEDLVHEVFVIVQRRLPDYDESRPLRPWLFGIALRTLQGQRARARRHPQASAHVQEPIYEGADAEDQLRLRQAQALLLRALDSLDMGQRSAFVLHELEGWTMPEIAAALEVPLNTAYSRLRLARAAVKTAVGRLKGAEP